MIVEHVQEVVTDLSLLLVPVADLLLVPAAGLFYRFGDRRFQRHDRLDEHGAPVHAFEEMFAPAAVRTKISPGGDQAPRRPDGSPDAAKKRLGIDGFAKQALHPDIAGFADFVDVGRIGLEHDGNIGVGASPLVAQLAQDVEARAVLQVKVQNHGIGGELPQDVVGVTAHHGASHFGHTGIPQRAIAPRQEIEIGVDDQYAQLCPVEISHR